MPLLTGTALGTYEVVGPIGAGGMGEVYRARDTRLKRDVALKLLPDLFAQDPERLARLAREAQMLAALNHPNIAQVYGFEESGAGSFLVMEFVDGPTLSDRIGAGRLPAADAVAIAIQIATALEAAHDKGIIHRDLKPANIKVNDAGVVKVLDFGIAKALTPVVAADAATIDATQEGAVIGTAAYMSPEQARGQAVDTRPTFGRSGLCSTNYSPDAGRLAR